MNSVQAKKLKIFYDDIEGVTLIFKREIEKYNAQYSTEQALEYFEKIINSIKVKGSSFKKYGYNLLPGIYEDLFWKHCFNYIKYKSLFDKYGFSARFDFGASSEWKMSGISRAIQVFQADHFHSRIKVFTKKIIFLLWLSIALLTGRRGEIWIDVTILNNHRYNVHESVTKNKVLPILSRWCSVRSVKRAGNSIEEAVETLIESRFGSYRFWKLAIYLLKPKRIIVKDNLFDNASLLLASKLMGVQIIGVSHGFVSLWHRGLLGSSNFFDDDTQIRYDKYFAWTNQMRQLLLEKGTIYKQEEVLVSGWLRKLPSLRNRKNNSSSKVVLYPYEWLSNYQVVLDSIDLLVGRGYEVIVKKHPDVDPFTSLNERKIKFVSDYSDEHYQNCCFVIASTTTMAIELSFIGRLVFLVTYDGFNMFAGQTYPNWVKCENPDQFFAAVESVENREIGISKNFKSPIIEKAFLELFQ